MALQFVNVTRRDLGRGLDTFSSKSAIPDGYVEAVRNFDTSASGRLEKRRGYEGYYGWVPWRAASVEAIQDLGVTVGYRLTFGTSDTVDLSLAAAGPLLMYGHLSSGALAGVGDDFYLATDTDRALWFPTFTSVSRTHFATGATTTTLTAAQHGYSTGQLLVGVAESLSPINRSNVEVLPDLVRVNPSTFEVKLGVTVANPAGMDAFVYFKDVSTVPGTTYNIDYTATVSDTATFDNTTDTVTSGATHTLNVGDAVFFSGTGTPPAALADFTTYYVVSTPTTTTFQVSATQGGAVLNFTDNGSGDTRWDQCGYYVPASTHSLINQQLLVYLVEPTDIPASTGYVLPETWTVDGFGNVTVEVSPLSPVRSRRVTIVSAPTANVFNASAATGTQTYTIPAPGGPLNFVQVYRYNTSTAKYESVYVDATSYDSLTDELSVTYTLASGTGEPVRIFWVTGESPGNVIEVFDPRLADDTALTSDAAPQITVWGLDHAGMYPADATAGGHVTHLDTYRRVAESRVVCGLGGVLFRALAAAEDTDGAYSIPTGLHASLQGQVSTAALLAPLFHSSNPGTVRTRGVVYDASVDSSNRALVTAATFVSPGVVDYTLSWTGKPAGVGGAIVNGGVLDVAFDRLTVSGLAHPEHSGSWTITSVVSDSTTQTVLRVANPGAVDTTTNESGALGRAGVFTDRLPLLAAPNWLADDHLLSAGVLDAADLVVVAVSGTTTYVSGVDSAVTLPGGITIAGRRTSNVVPLATFSADSVDTLVRGDMLSVSNLEDGRRVRVLAVNGAGTQTGTLSGSAGVVTITVTNPHYLAAGNLVTLYGNATLFGTHTVLMVSTPTTFTIAGTTYAGTVQVQGMAVTLDESLTFEDGNDATEFSVEGRWVPVEAPSTAYDLPATAYPRYFDIAGYADQAALHSTTLNDALWLTNGDDEVFKFDGVSLYRAGLPKWQLGLFAAVRVTGAPAVISQGAEIPYTAFSATNHTFTCDYAPVVPGDRIYTATTANQVLTVVDVSLDVSSNDYKVTVRAEDDLTGAAVGPGTFRKVKVYKYYVKLSAVDANGYQTSTAAAYSEDLVLDYVSEGEIQLRLVPPPAFGAFDYDRIECEVYRTVGGGSLFSLQSRRFVDFDQADPYISVEDSLEDSLILDPAANAFNPDVVNNTNLGSVGAAIELGTGWEPPPRAKHVTVLDNRLVLGNIRGWPEADIVFKPGVVTASSTTVASTITASQLADKTLSFRKDGSITTTTTNMVDGAVYQFKTSGDLAVGGITATTTDFTMTTGTPPAVGQWVYLFHSTSGVDKSLRFAGWWQVASVTAGSFTVSFNNSGAAATAQDVTRFVTASSGAVPVWIGTDGNYAQRDGNPTTDSWEIAAPIRLAGAINASMRATTTADFVPWLAAYTGQDYATGQLVVRAPSALATTPSVRVPAFNTCRFFVNSVPQTVSSERFSFETRVFQSRLVRSYVNYPEIFDSPFAALDVDSDSIIDVNPADGQAITAIIPFFGTSATGTQSQLSQDLVVFKSNSVYLVNIPARTVQRIDSRGQGCTAPKSVASTQNGVVFANESGVYRLNRDMTVSTVGRNLTGYVRTTLNRAAVSAAAGHHYAQGRRYKLSVPVGSDLTNSEVLVYDYDREGRDQEFGAWTVYDSHPATWWCNLDDDAFWASTAGDVFKLRDRSTASDYRDESAAITAVATVRADDFELPGIRKSLAHVTTMVELDETDLTDFQVETAINLATNFQLGGSITLDSSEFRHHTFKTPPTAHRGTHFQVRYTHATIDEACKITGLMYKVAQLSDKLVADSGDN